MLAQAVQQGDRPRLERYVDFPRLRASISAQAKSRVAGRMKREFGDTPLASLGTRVGSSVADRQVEAAVRRRGLRR